MVLKEIPAGAEMPFVTTLAGTVIRRGTTTETDPMLAARDLGRQLALPVRALSMVFCDPAMARQSAFLPALRRELGSAPIVACSTAGEIDPTGYRSGTCTGFSLPAGAYHAAATRIDSVRSLTPATARAAVDQVENELQALGVRIDPEHAFAILLVDGLSMAEEAVSYALQSALGRIELVGGSAGDGLEFGATFVAADDRFVEDAAVLVLVVTELPFRVFRTQHFEPTSTKLVVTVADARNRLLIEIDGRPAAEAYADVLGLDVAQLVPEVFARNPLLVRMGGSWFVRSIRAVQRDGSMQTFCAIDEGLVLTLGTCRPMPENLDQVLTRITREIGRPQVVFGCDCILRRLQAFALDQQDVMAAIFADHDVVGFNTYGEQIGAVHVNQTFTGVALT